MEAVPGLVNVPVSGGWRVVHATVTAEEQHAADLLAGDVVRSVHLVDVERTAIVLGSAQSHDSLDRAACDRLDVQVVRRRSGGGAVLLVPEEHVWMDVVIPRGDPHWSDDVSASAAWLGEVWLAGLATVGVAGRLHRGAPSHGPASPLVCFAGSICGEVLDERGAKLVGISQRRNRRGARFQCVVHRRWRPEVYAALLPGVDADALRPAAAVTEVAAAVLRGAMLDALAAA